MGSAVVIAPKASHDALQNVTPLLLGGILHNVVIPIDFNLLPNICPSHNSFKKMMKTLAKYKILCNISKMKQAVFIYLIADKANSDKRGGSESTFPIFFALFNPNANTVEEFLIDCDAAGESSDKRARAIKYYLKKLDYADREIILVGGTTDSGGGSTKESLKEAVRKLGVVTECYRINKCALNNLQTCLQNSVEKIFGQGGMTTDKNGKHEFKRNEMRLLNGLYNLFTYLNTSKIQAMWDHTCKDLNSTKKFSPLTNPVLTRWWLVGVTALEVDKSWKVWEHVMRGIKIMKRGKGNKDGSINEIAAEKLNIISMPQTGADVKSIATLYKFFHLPSLCLPPEEDPEIGGTAGYQTRILT